MNKAPFMTTAYGWVYVGFDPVDDEDYELLKQHLAKGGIDIEDVTFDQASLCGRLDINWTATIYEKGETGSPKLGGAGSHTYETQKVCGRNHGSGDIMFKDEEHDDIWHVNPLGERVYGQLDYGDTGRGYHVDEWGQTVAGPKPGTKAANRLGDGRYQWNKNKGWWVIRA